MKIEARRINRMLTDAEAMDADELIFVIAKLRKIFDAKVATDDEPRQREREDAMTKEFKIETPTGKDFAMAQEFTVTHSGALVFITEGTPWKAYAPGHWHSVKRHFDQTNGEPFSPAEGE